MMNVLYGTASSPKLFVVSGDTKEGTWKEMHNAHLPEMFQKFRKILAEQLDARFHCTTTPDKHTLLALAFDPSVDVNADSGIFASRSATQVLMEGEWRRALLRRQYHMRAQAPAPAPVPAPTPTAQPAPARALARAPAPAPAPGTPGKQPSVLGKRPPCVLAMMQPAAKVASGVVQL